MRQYRLGTHMLETAVKTANDITRESVVVKQHITFSFV